MDLDSLNALFYTEEPTQPLPIADPTPNLLYYHETLKRYMSYPEWQYRHALGVFDTARKASGKRATASQAREKQVLEYMESLGMKAADD